MDLKLTNKLEGHLPIEAQNQWIHGDMNEQDYENGSDTRGGKFRE